MPEINYSVRIATWPQDQKALQLLREKIFIIEQHVPVELEWDGLDENCMHVLASLDTGPAIGTARLHINEETHVGHIGRMCVLPAYRRSGVATSLLRLLLNQATQLKLKGFQLNAQTYITAFYEQFGFVCNGDEFLDAGIPHLQMRLDLPD